MSASSERVAIVTGGERGLGLAIATRLRQDGLTVVTFDREGSPPVDVTDEAAVTDAVTAVTARHGRIDVLVNNAGIYPHTAFDELTLAEWRRVLATNLDGVFICAKAVYPVMKAQRSGRIVNIASAAFLVGEYALTHYVASKGGVIGFTRALATGAGAYGITVNAVSPGFVDTPGVNSSPEELALFDRIVGEQAISRRGRPEDIAACVSYLAGPDASFITGQTINVDGGHRFI